MEANIDIFDPKASETFKLSFSAEVMGLSGVFALDDFQLVEGTCSEVTKTGGNTDN